MAAARDAGSKHRRYRSRAPETLSHPELKIDERGRTRRRADGLDIVDPNAAAAVRNGEDGRKGGSHRWEGEPGSRRRKRDQDPVRRRRYIGQARRKRMSRTTVTTVGDERVEAEMEATGRKSAPGAPGRRGDLFSLLSILRRAGIVAETESVAKVGARRDAAHVRGRGGRKQPRLGEGRSSRRTICRERSRERCVLSARGRLQERPRSVTRPPTHARIA